MLTKNSTPSFTIERRVVTCPCDRSQYRVSHQLKVVAFAIMHTCVIRSPIYARSTHVVLTGCLSSPRNFVITFEYRATICQVISGEEREGTQRRQVYLYNNVERYIASTSRRCSSSTILSMCMVLFLLAFLESEQRDVCTLNFRSLVFWGTSILDL